MKPKITALKAQKRNSRRTNVYLDGEFAFGLSNAVAAMLKIGQEISEEQVAALEIKDRDETAYQQALKLLSYRPRSEKEVRTNLEKHCVDPIIVDNTIDRLKKSGLINDKNFARQWVENRIDFRPRSLKLLSLELRQKGISAEIIEQSLINIDEESLAYSTGTKQAHKWTHLDRWEFKRKLGSHLSRRGFTYDLIESVLEKIWDENQPT
ncbi:MAG: RecX family transcriptional regulator [Anaerolineales bacterium]|nr:RecX family transcriptional regulator [Anaerolineales bacterium]